MIEVIRKIVANVLTNLYEPFFSAVLMAVLFMFVFMFAEEIGYKNLLYKWCNGFRSSSSFRCQFFLSFYTCMILFRTLLNRNMWVNPVSNVIGVWGFYNEKGELTTQAIENLLLFIPFAVLFMWCFREKIIGRCVKITSVLWKSGTSVFLFSLTIEFLQLFLRLGTFQLSDLFYNTLGGFIGGLLYWSAYKVIHKQKRKQ